MSRFGRILRKVYLAITSLAVIAAFTGATYAWFSANMITTTGIVSSATDTKNVRLSLASSPGGSAQGAEQAAITKVNTESGQEMMPVSTADLTTFYFNPYTEDKKATVFTKVEKEKFYYHGRIYLQAVAEGMPDNCKLKLYLDESQYGGGSILQNAPGMAKNALRVGLKFDNGSPLILRLSEGANPDGNRFMNTVIDDKPVEGNIVLAPSGEKVIAVADPSVPYTSFCVGENGLPTDSGGKPLMVLDLNHEYVLDIYVYLEGCDPDCTIILSLENFDFHLGFYGVLTEEANE